MNNAFITKKLVSKQMYQNINVKNELNSQRIQTVIFLILL